jgi:PAS domain S-box-containing protein
MVDEKTLLLKRLMDALPEGIISMDMEGNITTVNKGAIDILGYNSINLIGKPIFDLAPSFEKKDFQDIFRQIASVGTIKARKIRLYDAKGRLHNIEISISLLRDGKGNPIGMVSTIKNIKDVAKLERELEELKDFSQSILNNAGAGIIATDLKGEIIFASKGTRNIFKKSSKDLIGQNVIKDSANPLELNEKFISLIKTGKSFEYESEVHERGKIRNFMNIFTILRDRNKDLVGTIAVFNDVSKLKEIEGELKNTNAILREYTKNLESLIDVTQTLSSSLKQEKIYKIIAEAAKKVLNVDVSGFFRYSEKHKKLVLSSAEGIDSKIEEKKSYSHLLKLKRPRIVSDLTLEKSLDIPSKFLEAGLKSAVFVPIFTKDKIFGVLAVFSKEHKQFKKEEIEILQSIGNSAAIATENALLYNEVKEFAAVLEKKVRERTAELEQSNRLKDLFIDIMGHDLLKPAEIARLSVELVLDSETDQDKKKILQNILHSSERIIGMIENASLLAKLESGEKLEFKKGDLGVVLRDVVEETVDFAVDRDVKIEIDADGVFSALVNPLIYDVFSNLLGNALKYGSDDSSVVAKISDGGSNWRISIADRGQGIPDEHKEAVFDRFKRLEKGAVKGSGLGLAIVKKVVEAHDGRSWVEDNPGGGSIFYVEIPKTNTT